MNPKHVSATGDPFEPTGPGRSSAPHDLDDEVRTSLQTSMATVHIAEPPIDAARSVLRRAQVTQRRRQRRERAAVGVAVVVLLFGAALAVSRARQDGAQGVDAGATPPGSAPGTAPVTTNVSPPTTVVVPVPTSVVPSGSSLPRRSLGTIVPPSTTQLAPAAPATPAGSSDDVPHIALPGWTTTYFVVVDAANGWPQGPPYTEYQFTKGDQRLQVSFYAESDFDARASHNRELVDVRGGTGRLLDYGGGRYRVNLVERGRTWEADGGPYPSLDAFLEVVDQIQHVDEATWKASLPAGAVTDDERAATVDKILVGVPIPPGFDVEGLRTKAQPNGWYQLSAEVLGSVECAWIERWLDAPDDTTQKPEAVAALAGVSSWPAWQAMRAEGEYPDVAAEYARRAVRGDRAGLEGYEAALGC